MESIVTKTLREDVIPELKPSHEHLSDDDLSEVLLFYWSSVRENLTDLKTAEVFIPYLGSITVSYLGVKKEIYKMINTIRKFRKKLKVFELENPEKAQVYKDLIIDNTEFLSKLLVVRNKFAIEINKNGGTYGQKIKKLKEQGKSQFFLEKKLWQLNKANSIGPKGSNMYLKGLKELREENGLVPNPSDEYYNN